jgi:hypothetical protein
MIGVFVSWMRLGVADANDDLLALDALIDPQRRPPVSDDSASPKVSKLAVSIFVDTSLTISTNDSILHFHRRHIVPITRT